MKIISVQEQLEAMYNIAGISGMKCVDEIRDAMFVGFDQEYGVRRHERQWTLADVPTKKQIDDFEKWLNED